MDERRREPGSPDYESTALNHYTTLERYFEEVCMHTEAHTKNKLSLSLRCYWKDFFDFIFVLTMADEHGYQCGVVVKSGRLVIWGTGFVSPLLHMQLLGDLGLVTLL